MSMGSSCSACSTQLWGAQQPWAELLARQLVAAAIRNSTPLAGVDPAIGSSEHRFKSTGFRKMLPVVLHIQKIQLIGTSLSKGDTVLHRNAKESVA